MRSKSKELMTRISDFIDYYYNKIGRIPTVREIANSLEVSIGTVSNYINAMAKSDMIEYSGDWRTIKTESMKKQEQDIVYLPVVGSIACGTPILAEQNIETYLPVPTRFIGKGKFFILKARGNSMVKAGIDSGDIVIVRKQQTAEEGQIVVALIDDEATLKRYYIDKKNQKIRLHPENDELQDMYFDKVEIQGIAVKIVKDLI